MQLDTIMLIVSDLDTAVHFYSETLGFQLTHHFPGDYAAFHLDQGVTLSLHVPHAGHVHHLAAGGLELSFTVADVDGTVAALRARGVQFVSLPSDMPWGAREAQLADPDGHVLTLKQSQPGASITS